MRITLSTLLALQVAASAAFAQDRLQIEVEAAAGHLKLSPNKGLRPSVMAGA